MPVMDAYIRVSRVGEREGEAYRSPVIQREEIERWATRESVDLAKIVIDEDVSGGRPVAERGLEDLIRRAEEGETSGVVVYRLDRFSREMAATAVAVKRLRDANARLVAVADGLDSAAPNGQMVIAIMSVLAEQYLENVKANWQAATSRAVDSGVHISARAPLGYVRTDEVDPKTDSKGRAVRNGRLLVDSEAADVVRRAFDMRAAGDSYRVIAEEMGELLGRGVAKTSVAGILKNRAYLGEARGPNGAVKKGAHEALVTEQLFSQVQPKTGQYHPRNGTMAAQALLAGLITCASCGHKLRTLGSAGKGGVREASYVCAKRYASGECEAPAAARVKLVDEYVTTRLQDDEQDVKSSVASAERRYLETREKVRLAEEALDSWVDDADIAISLGPQRFQRGVLARQRALDEARRELWSAEDVGVDSAETVRVGGELYVYGAWGEDRDADRRTLRRHIASVTLAKADPKRRRWQPIAERVEVRWVGSGLTRSN